MRPANELSHSTTQSRRSKEAIKPEAPWTISKRVLLVSAGCSILLILAIYSRSLNFQFILDDHRFTADPRIQDSGHLWDYFANYVWAQFTGGPSTFYRPVFVLWMRINFVLSALSPWGWHLLSILKHLFVAGLLGMLVCRLLHDGLASLLAAIVFALHPAQTESVSWVTVPDPLMAAGILGSLLLYLKFLDVLLTAAPPRTKKSRRASRSSPTKWLIASAAAYLLALFAKETALIFPLVILALGFSIDPSDVAGKAAENAGFSLRLQRASAHAFPFVCVTGIYLLIRFHALGGHLFPATQQLPWRTLILSAPATLWFYATVLFWPIHSHSFADPTLVEAWSGRGALLPLLAVAGLAAILAAAIAFAWEKNRGESIGEKSFHVQFALISGTLLLLLPIFLALNLNALNPGDFLHGRYTYLPLCGLMPLLAVGFHLARRSRKLFFVCAAGGLTIVFAALTYSQEAQWKDDSTVFTVAHQIAPRNLPVAQNLANTRVQAALELDQEGRCSEALPIFEQVTRDYSQDWYAWAGLADCLVQTNDLTKAEQALHHAAELSHDPRVIQQWQELRTHMGLPN